MKRNIIADLKAQGFAPQSLLDVGAHLGHFSKEFVATFPGCVPVVIEPNPHCLDALKATGFETHLVAASNVNEEGELYLTKEWLQSTGSSLYRENTHFFRDDVVVKQPIKKVCLDDLLKGRQFDFVKIDTQGAELDVLRGGAEVLRSARFILVEVSLVNYNQGGACAEDLFEQLDRMGFHCTEVTEFHRLKGVQDGNLLQIDVLFEPRQMQRANHLRPVQVPAPLEDVDRLSGLAAGLVADGRLQDAIALLSHLNFVHATNASILRQLIKALTADGRNLEAVEKLLQLKRLVASAKDVIEDIQGQLPSAIEKFNECLARGDVVAAEAYASGFANLVPGNVALVNSAMSCNVALGRAERAVSFANALLMIEPAHEGAKAVLAQFGTQNLALDQTIAQRIQSLIGPLSGQHPLVRLRDIHDLVGEFLCLPLAHAEVEQVRVLLEAASKIDVDVPEGTDLAGWVKHYQLAFQALDLPMMLAETPKLTRDEPISFVSSSGKASDWGKVQALAKRLDAKAVFFAAADEAYVEMYARWYIKSILKHCDVPFLVVVHVIGGGGNLKQIATRLGIDDDRVVLCGDAFDAAAVSTRCFDTPPKGLIARPVAHFQSVRFLRLGALLKKLNTPVFVSDIDLLLQRGVADLMDRCAGSDVVFNENTSNKNPGSRLTANLMLVQPTDRAHVMLRFLQAYLMKALGGSEVSRWIDQFALTMARHHLRMRAPEAVIAYFDTTSDINNVMYRSFEKNPFRFLSLYHGFDTSTLEIQEEPVPNHVNRTKSKKRKVR